MTLHKSPLVSVGMAVHNCEKTVGTAIRSILRQSYTEWELIVIDDGSTDGTLEAARNFDDSRIRIIDGRAQQGISARLNQPVSLAYGEYFARMDGDDVAYPERLARQVQYLEAHAEIDLLGAGILVFKGDGRAIGTRTIWQTHEQICRRPWSGFYLPHSTWMARIEWFRKNPYRENARIGDADLMLRTYRSNRFASLPDILVGYREDFFSLRKALNERRYFVNELTKKSPLGGNRAWLEWRGVPEHILKAMAEIIAFATGQPYRILRHRALPVTRDEMDRWEMVWANLENSDAQTIASLTSLGSPIRREL